MLAQVGSLCKAADPWLPLSSSSETRKRFLNCMDIQVARKANDYK